MMQLIGGYRYSGSICDGRTYSIIRNGDELQRVREILTDCHPIVWDTSMAMTLDVLNILRHENPQPGPAPEAQP